MTATNFNTENRTYRQLLGNGLVYSIPRFQRDYSWGDEEWDDLWLDILGTLNDGGEPAHYLGYLVLQTSDNRNFAVIDGQQRLTTMSLIVLGAIRLLQKYVASDEKAPENQKRLDQLRATYIGYLDPVTLITRNKLTLNRNDNPYYQRYMVPLTEQLPQRGFPASTHTMRKGFEWFEWQLLEYTKNEPDPGMALAQFVETISDRLFFTVITVADELNAYKVFETLNARGVRLSSTDLLKNYLFSVLSREKEDSVELDELEERWISVVERLGSEDFPNFLRMHWNSRHSFARHAELFKVIRKHVQNREQVFALLREMDSDIDTYLALTQPEGSEWSRECKQDAQYLRMFSVRQPYPMLMAAKRVLNEGDFGKLLRSIVVISFRYNVIGALNPNDQEIVYNSTANKLHNGEVKTISDVLNELRTIYPSDTAFTADFTDKSIKTTHGRNSKIVCYILTQLEKQDSGTDLNIESGYTVEHILPQNPENGWEAFSDRDMEFYNYRIGNMVLLEGSKNKEIGNLPFSEKRIVLLTSSIPLTKQVAEKYDVWTPESIASWQSKLARLATTVWKIDQLS